MKKNCSVMNQSEVDCKYKKYVFASLLFFSVLIIGCLSWAYTQRANYFKTPRGYIEQYAYDLNNKCPFLVADSEIREVRIDGDTLIYEGKISGNANDLKLFKTYLLKTTRSIGLWEYIYDCKHNDINQAIVDAKFTVVLEVTTFDDILRKSPVSIKMKDYSLIEECYVYVKNDRNRAIEDYMQSMMQFSNSLLPMEMNGNSIKLLSFSTDSAHVYTSNSAIIVNFEFAPNFKIKEMKENSFLFNDFKSSFIADEIKNATFEWIFNVCSVSSYDVVFIVNVGSEHIDLIYNNKEIKKLITKQQTDNNQDL